jgi:methylated-DNA-protein-cysteine methyltransferase related protein
VKLIPPNKVVYFGQIAERVGVSAQIVGFVLSGMSVEESQNIPWYRVIAKNGYISALKLGHKGEVQREILLNEGYLILDDQVNMERHLWDWVLG